MIQAKSCGLRYPDGTEALKNLDFEIGAGELVFLTGESGSGKTSTIRIMLGMERPTAGSFEILGVRLDSPGAGGTDYPDERAIRALRRRIGTVFQSFRLIGGRTAIANVMLPLRFADRRLSRAQMRDAAFGALHRVGLASKADKSVDLLSQGEAQRVAIARAIVTDPELIIADEPTGNLDPDNSLAVLQLLASLAGGSRAVVVTTHAVHLIDAIEAAVRHRIELRSGAVVRDVIERGAIGRSAGDAAGSRDAAGGAGEGGGR